MNISSSKAMYILIALVTALLLVVFWFVLLSPKRDAIALAQEETEQAIDQQTTVRNRIRTLEAARSRAPDIEAEMALASAIIPEGTDMPAALRALQDAADSSGVEIMSVLPDKGRLSAMAPELREIQVAVAVEGGFFQIVDFMRRVEDPRITSRAMVTDYFVMSSRSYPRLRIDMGITMFYTELSPAAAAAAAAVAQERRVMPVLPDGSSDTNASAEVAP